MTPTAPTAPATTEQNIDHLLHQIETAWVTEEFDAIIAANWPAQPREPPPAAEPTHPEPPFPPSSAPPQPRSRLTDPHARPRARARQRAPPRAARDK
jgi:hypothetical protein